MVQYLRISSLTKVFRKPGFWLILVLLVLITLPHYEEALEHPAFLCYITHNIGLARHAIERILYLAPIVWAGFLFGWRGGFVTSLAALACMLPRAVFISPSPLDAIFETSAVVIIGSVLTFSLASLRREREYRSQLETAHRELRKSEETYRRLFENAHDAIWLHDMDGNIIAANTAAKKVTGYSVEELTKMNVRSFLSEESLHLARQIRTKLLQNKPVDQPYEQYLIRKDGTESFMQLTTSLVPEKGESMAFQHIARDITEQKRMQENVRLYSQQAIRAQEEERKRLSREIHDEAIQALVVHARRLDALASKVKGLPEEDRLRLEEIWQEANDITRRLRRLGQDLRPPVLERLGLLPALEWLASDVTEYSGIATTVNAVGSKRRLSEEAELVLFRIVQEALRNVWRHAEATQAEVVVKFDERKTKITIGDNGKGFNLPQRIGDLAKDGKLGLAGMQERAHLLSGTLRVQSELGRGTTITAVIPA